MNQTEKLDSKPAKCPKCKKKNTIKETPAAYWCSNIDGCTWTAGKMPPYGGLGGPVVERRDY